MDKIVDKDGLAMTQVVDKYDIVEVKEPVRYVWVVESVVRSSPDSHTMDAPRAEEQLCYNIFADRNNAMRAFVGEIMYCKKHGWLKNVEFENDMYIDAKPTSEFYELRYNEGENFCCWYVFPTFSRDWDMVKIILERRVLQ